MQRLSLAFLMLFAFAVPWEYSLDVGQPYGNVARILGVLLLLAVVPGVLVRRGLRRPGVLQWLVLALYLYFVCSYFWTLEAESTLEKMRAYFQVMMVVWLVWEIGESPEQLRALMRAFVAGCWVLALLTFKDYLSGSAAVEQVRFVAEGQDPNDAARFLDLGFPLAALLFAVEEGWAIRLAAIAYVPAGLLAVLLTASRGGFSAALISLLGSAMLLIRWRPRASAAVFLGLAVTVGALWLFVPVESLDRLATIPEQAGSLNDRLNIWTAGFHAFAQAPWWGTGAGTFTQASNLATGDTAHNTLMAILVTGGLSGLAIFLAILARVAWAVAQTRGLMRIALGTTLAVWMITSMVGSVEENRATWLIFGLMGLAGRLETEQQTSMVSVFSGRESERQTEPALAVL
jgi:hypothetical protein